MPPRTAAAGPLTPPGSHLTLAPVPAAAMNALRTPAPHWIHSPAFDLVFFIAAPVVMLPVVLGALWWSNAFALLGFTLAFARALGESLNAGLGLNVKSAA